jgi:O-antigen ligase
MTGHQINTDFGKSKGLLIFEYILLTVCLAVIAIRSVSIESLNINSANRPESVGELAYSLALSTVLILTALGWLIWLLYRKKFIFRITTMELGLALFCIAAVIASCFAAEKRAAITNSVTTIAPMMMAVMLVQILDSKKKIIILLYTIAAVGAIGALYCLVQFSWLNNVMLAQYQNDPSVILEKLRIPPGSFQQMLFEHSLNSKDVRGFFTTGNSAGSFALLTSFAAIALFLQNLKTKGPAPKKRLKIIIHAIITITIISGLLITRSKGSIAAVIIALAILIACITFGKWIAHRKKEILLASLLLVTIGGYSVVSYRLKHGCLPGGNSMLVRWQYWHASVKMYADHPLTGVGPGNFVSLYPRYKQPSAIETVADPHNFLLNILTQYGPLGLAAFLAAIIVPLAKVFFAQNKTKDFVSVSLFAAVIGCLLHNCIDFAIFEPAILTTFWAIIACIIALHLNQSKKPSLVLRTNGFVRALALLFAAAAVWAHLSYVFLPVAKSSAKITLAHQAQLYGSFDEAHTMLNLAAKDDPLSPIAPAINGRMYILDFHLSPNMNPDLLIAAEQNFHEAIKRNNADFKNFDNLIEVYRLLAQTSTRRQGLWLNKALNAAQSAVALYPCSDGLRFQLAELADRLNKTHLAITQYEEVVNIEDKYRAQFQIMYPGRAIFSRLGEEQYSFAKQRIKELKKISTQ